MKYSNTLRVQHAALIRVYIVVWLVTISTCLVPHNYHLLLAIGIIKIYCLSKVDDYNTTLLSILTILSIRSLGLITTPCRFVPCLSYHLASIPWGNLLLLKYFLSGQLCHGTKRLVHQYKEKLGGELFTENLFPKNINYLSNDFWVLIKCICFIPFYKAELNILLSDRNMNSSS